MNPDERYDRGHDVGYYCGLSDSLLEVAKAVTVADAIARISTLMKGEV